MNVIDKITSSSPEAKSLDIAQQNIEQLKQLFPDVFSENKIDFEALKAALGEQVDDSQERYNFTWNGKNKARQIAQTQSTGTLRPCKDESINWDTTENLFIEGDNLEVLKLLQKSYHKKVKMIYIDPPYNTGKDFVYNDDFSEGLSNYFQQTGQVDDDGNKLSTNSDASGRYHSNWLSMLYPRLKLARNLLQDDGLIFISIDDSEVSNLKMICNEIFGNENCVTEIVWKNKTGGGAKTKGWIGLHEYILVYAKNYAAIADISIPYSEKTASMFKSKDENYETRGPYATWPLDTTSMGDRPNLKYPIFHEGVEIWPEKQWLWSKERAEKAQLENGLVFNKQGNGSYKVRFKGYLRNEDGEMRRGKPLSIIEGAYSQDGSKDIQEFIPKGVFPFPKPIKLIKSLLEISTKETAVNQGIILDFFAGSGTTGQAVMEFNHEQNCDFRYIAVQLPEVIEKENKDYKSAFNFCVDNKLKTSISEITKYRIRKASEKIKGLNCNIDAGVKVFKLSQTNIRPWDADFENLELVLQQATESIKGDRSSEDVLYEIFLKYGYELTTPVNIETVNDSFGNEKQVFVVGAGALIVCLDDEITAEVVEGIAKLKDELDPETTQVVFKDAGFADSNAKTNAIQILKQAGIDDVKSI
ncbi:site-specific DNA-methyltransferase [Shewanella frigidimarina]|uniref:site-specific DNA-methyltransferase n=1 Tax=Shewanella frigidimarina TaxID=56812 RepID=UPI003D7B6EB4